MSKKVLIVEDYADVRRIMKIMIGLRGYEVVEAEDGYEALEKAKLHHPDLILMDYAMPLMDGLTATQAIRKFADCKKVPIVLVSAYGKAKCDIALECGCNEVINKPIDFKGLEPLLNRYLN